MKAIDLNMKEQNTYKIIKKLVETNGNKNRAAINIGCTLRNINLLIKKYNEYGKSAFSHGNKKRKPANSISKETKRKIVFLYRNEYYGFNWKHFCEKLVEVEHISITYNTLHNILSTAGFISPLAFKRTKRKKALELEEKKKLSNIDKTVIFDNLILDKSSAHPRKPRAKYFGELVQMDASSFYWWDDVRYMLHLAVDDCTGEVLGAYFDKEETLNGYYNVLFQILNNYGIPNEFLTDNRTVFIYRQKKNPTVDQDTSTQFGYACKQLGISISTSSIPQKKGRIERLNGTFQRRLPQELRRESIHNVDDANSFLSKFVKDYNRRFSLRNNNTKSVFESKPKISKINQTLAIISNRMFDNGSSIKYKNEYYQAVSSFDTNILTFKKGTKALVISTFDNHLYVSVEDKIYPLIKVLKHKEKSKDFDLDYQPKKSNPIWTPPMSHPWKAKSFNNYLAKARYKNNSRANV